MRMSGRVCRRKSFCPCLGNPSTTLRLFCPLPNAGFCPQHFDVSKRGSTAIGFWDKVFFPVMTRFQARGEDVGSRGNVAAKARNCLKGEGIVRAQYLDINT